MRRYGWEDFALPLALVFAVSFTLTLRQQVELSNPVTPALAASVAPPDYVITVTAKRIPTECRTAAVRTAACQSALAGETRMEMREGATRLAEREVYAY